MSDCSNGGTFMCFDAMTSIAYRGRHRSTRTRLLRSSAPHGTHHFLHSPSVNLFPRSLHGMLRAPFRQDRLASAGPRRGHSQDRLETRIAEWGVKGYEELAALSLVPTTLLLPTADPGKPISYTRSSAAVDDHRSTSQSRLDHVQPDEAVSIRQHRKPPPPCSQ